MLLRTLRLPGATKRRQDDWKIETRLTKERRFENEIWVVWFIITNSLIMVSFEQMFVTVCWIKCFPSRVNSNKALG